MTAETRAKTRDKILEAACRLIASQGFDGTTTRDIATEAGIATGTLFNYYPSKEALGMSLLSAALERADAGFRASRRGDESLEELLFAHIIAGLRSLAPYRQTVGPIVESGLSPFTADSASIGQRLRAEHLETVANLIAEHDAMPAPSFVAMHLYWTLYLGVLAFWSGDPSPNQEDTLVVLDQSLRLFVSSLLTDTQMKEVSRGT
ncbi:MAG: TetR/AcrR family transcriptional regulator [Phycisphaerae bacterium]